jgi:tetratricopeptide (TPR) repeat protein
MLHHNISGPWRFLVLVLGVLVAFPLSGAAQTNRASQSIDLGDDWMDKGKYDEAIAEYSAALRLDPGSARAFNNRGFAWYKLGIKGKAVEDFSEAIRLRPGYVQALNNRGNAYNAMKRFDAAIGDFTRALEINPLEAAALLGRSFAYRSSNQHQKAIADYTGLIEQAEKNRSSKGLLYLLNERAISAMAQKDYDKAIADLETALRLDPTYKWAHANRGKCWREKGDYERSITDLNEAVRLDPKFTWALNELGQTWIKKKQFEQAIDVLTRAIQADPKYKWAHAGRGWCWREMGERDKALADFDAALGIDMRYTWVRGQRARVLFEKGEADKAATEWKQVIAEYTRTIALAPTDEFAHHSLAWLLATCPIEQLRDGPKAVKLALRAGELAGGKTSNWLDTLAAAYAEAGQFDKAVVYQTQALAMNTPGYDREAGQGRLDQYRQRQPHREPNPAAGPELPTK